LTPLRGLPMIRYEEGKACGIACFRLSGEPS